ncbi:flagellar biosynthesis repressor FlbT [Fodinicurvata sp. EGI_FJ10296]|uniref:flagellar biosynthesis repressor FlbT n=1 Tax=Fodinicurvata sp. EGI_FJ10296 TaxID=3231908 RepID=UPI003455D740
MPLVLELKPKEKVVINGAVIVNDNRRSRLTISTFAHVMREKDILQEQEANTPAKRVYFLIQLLLLAAGDRNSIEAYGQPLENAIAALGAALTNAEIKEHLGTVSTLAARGDYYKAIIALRPVMEYEARLLNISDRPPTADPTG